MTKKTKPKPKKPRPLVQNFEQAFSQLPTMHIKRTKSAGGQTIEDVELVCVAYNLDDAWEGMQHLWALAKEVK